MFYMANKLGAWQIDGDEEKGRVSFKLFFPKGFDPEIESIRVAGSFQDLAPGIENLDFTKSFPLDRDESNREGTFWSYTTEKMLPAGFYQYKYMVQFTDGSTRIVSDPCTRYGRQREAKCGFRHRWQSTR